MAHGWHLIKKEIETGEKTQGRNAEYVRTISPTNLAGQVGLCAEQSCQSLCRRIQLLQNVLGKLLFGDELDILVL